LKRRDFIAAIGAAAAWPHGSRAQRPAMPVIGFVNAVAPAGYERAVSSFLKGLGEAGFVDGRNVTIEYRWAEGHYDRLPAFVSELIDRKVSVIAATSTPAALAAGAAKPPMPVVFTTSGDPVRLGLVQSLSRPGGNITGAATLNVEVAPKRFELIHEALPAATNIGLLVNPTSPIAAQVSRDMREAAARYGLKLQSVSAKSDDDLAAVFDALTQQKIEALVVGTDVFFTDHAELIAKLAFRHRVPAIYQYPDFTAAGGLMSYGGDLAESYRLAGGYVGRILGGEKPADLPVQEVTKVVLIINLKTAKTFDIKFPLSILGRADEVIE